MRLAIAFAALLSASALAADLVARGNAGDELRLMAGPCVHAGTLAQIKPEYRASFKKAQGTHRGKMFYGCWIAIPEDVAVWVLLEDGQSFALPVAAFEVAPEV